jgi:long-chain acyl-CoA synthetase
VPRLFEVIRERIMASLEKEGGLRLKLFQRAIALGLRKLDGPPLGLFERVQDAVLERLVRAKVRARFGGAIEALISGGARLDPELSGFFLALGVMVIQGYGQSEAGPVISVNLPWDNDRRSVGKPLPGVEVRLAEDGELLVRGGLVMDGYWNNPDATAQALRIPDGEGEAEVAQAVAAGEGMAGVVALIVPAEGQTDRVGEAVKRVNARLSNIERIRRFQTLPEGFTVENGLLTPTMKIKRRQVLQRYGAEVAALG